MKLYNVKEKDTINERLERKLDSGIGVGLLLHCDVVCLKEVCHQLFSTLERLDTRMLFQNPGAQKEKACCVSPHFFGASVCWCAAGVLGATGRDELVSQICGLGRL